MTKRGGTTVVHGVVTILGAALLIATLASANGAKGGRRLGNEFLAFALIAQCIEFGAFVWFALVPAFTRGITRLTGRERAADDMGQSKKGDTAETALLLVGPTVAVLTPVSGWLVGYRVLGSGFLVVVLVALLPTALNYRNEAAWQRPVATETPGCGFHLNRARVSVLFLLRAGIRFRAELP